MKIEFTIKDCDTGKYYTFNGEGENFGEALDTTELAVVYEKDCNILVAKDWLENELPRIAGITLSQGIIARFMDYMLEEGNVYDVQKTKPTGKGICQKSK